MIPISTFWNIMRSCSITSRSSFRTNPCHHLLWPISHLVPQVFQHPSQIKFRHRVNLSIFISFKNLPEEPISHPPSDPSESPIYDSLSSSLPSSRFPSLSPSKGPPDKTIPDPSSPPSLLLSASPIVTPKILPSDMPSFF